MQEITTICDMGHAHKREAQNIKFGLDGDEFDIDLCGSDAQRFRKMVQSYIEKAHKAGTQVRPTFSSTSSGRSSRRSSGRSTRPTNRKNGTGRRTKRDREASKNVRAWGVEQGLLEAGKRGRIPEHVTRGYRVAHGLI